MISWEMLFTEEGILRALCAALGIFLWLRIKEFGELQSSYDSVKCDLEILVRLCRTSTDERVRNFVEMNYPRRTSAERGEWTEEEEAIAASGGLLVKGCKVASTEKTNDSRS